MTSFEITSWFVQHNVHDERTSSTIELIMTDANSDLRMFYKVKVHHGDDDWTRGDVYILTVSEVDYIGDLRGRHPVTLEDRMGRTTDESIWFHMIETSVKSACLRVCLIAKSRYRRYESTTRVFTFAPMQSPLSVEHNVKVFDYGDTSDVDTLSEFNLSGCSNDTECDTACVAVDRLNELLGLEPYVSDDPVEYRIMKKTGNPFQCSILSDTISYRKALEKHPELADEIKAKFYENWLHSEYYTLSAEMRGYGG